MIRNQNIICISSIDWDFIWQSHQEIMSTFAKNGNRVLFIENTGVRTPGIHDILRIRSRIKNWFKGVKGIRKEGEGLYVFSPIILPFPYSRMARFINRHLMLRVLDRWMKIMKFGNPIVWTFLPTPLVVDIMENVTKKLTVYYCVDNFRVSSPAARRIARSEEAMLKKVDVVFAASGQLYSYCRRFNEEVYRFPIGVSFDIFEKARRSGDTKPGELAGLSSPVIGYVGGIHKWIDLDLIRRLAVANPAFSFVFVGPIQTDVSAVSGLENVIFLGNKDHSRIPYYIAGFDVCMIPYVLSEYTKNVYPAKLNEYLAMGKPVVSTALIEVLEFNKNNQDIVLAAVDADSFNDCIGKAISEGDQKGLREARIKASEKNKWDSRIEEMSSLLQKKISENERNAESKWRENLLVFYRKARRRAVSWGILILLLYLLLFRTPFIFLTAWPLKISDSLRKADAVVVFGGGVGETGNPGKSTIERARYAAELYNKGYAKKIIFSSGYTYKYNDAANMRLIALSDGVSDRDIILELQANSAYENVMFTKNILDKNGWRSIIIVSAPYNMRRASLVVGRHFRGLEVCYAPVKPCQFYDRPEGIKLEQIKAIAHEYLGIVYYWFKGYI